MTKTEAELYNSLGSILEATQQLMELQTKMEKMPTTRLAGILYEKNRYSSYDEQLNFLKSLIASYEGYKEFIQELNDNFDLS